MALALRKKWRWANLLRWWLRWRRLRAEVDADGLMASEGLRPGPALGQRLRQLRAERLARERC